MFEGFGNFVGGLIGSDDEKLKQLMANQRDTIAQNLTASGVDDFAAADAANLASQGIGEGQMGQILGQAGVQDANFVAADATGMAQTVAQNQPSGFDLKGLVKDLDFGKVAESGGGSLYNQEIKKQGLLQTPRATATPAASAMPMAPQASNAMQTIQSGIGANPNLDMMLRALGYGR